MKGLLIMALFLLQAFSLQAQTAIEKLEKGLRVGGKAEDFAEICRVDLKKGEKMSVEIAAGTGYCSGFFYGVMLSENVANVAIKQGKKLYCIPSGVTSGQISKVFLRWIDNHPERLHERGCCLRSAEGCIPMR
jgi:hypothetical protein